MFHLQRSARHARQGRLPELLKEMQQNASDDDTGDEREPWMKAPSALNSVSIDGRNHPTGA